MLHRRYTSLTLAMLKELAEGVSFCTFSGDSMDLVNSASRRYMGNPPC